MTARKLDNTNPSDNLVAFHYMAYAKTIRTETRALNPDECAGYTAATMIPGLNDTDWEVIYVAVNEAVEKVTQGTRAPEAVLVFEISDYLGSPHLVVIELLGYVSTGPCRWTAVRTSLLTRGK